MRTGARSQYSFVVLLLLSAAVFGSAQEAPVQRYQEEIVVRVIDVDVVVTDREGRPVTDLKREHFELLENGKPVEIRYFSRVVDGQLRDLPQGEQSVIAQQPGNSSRVRVPLTWVVFLDQTSIPRRHRDQAMEQLRKFLERAIADGDRGIVASNDGMAFRIREPLTEQRSRILDAVARLQKERSWEGEAVRRASRIRNELRAVRGQAPDQTGESDQLIVTPEEREFIYFGEWIGSEIAMVIEEEVRRTRNAIAAMNALIDALAHVEGRLAVVYVGAGFNTIPALALTESWRSLFQVLLKWAGAPRPEDHQSRLEQDVARLYANLSAGRVTVYTVYAGENWMPGADDAGMDSALGAQRAELTEAGFAREMADRTGGRFFRVHSRLADHMEAMHRDLNNYYSLGYVPKGEPGRSRSVRVHVKQHDVRVRHRDAVRERTSREEAARAEVASLIAPQRMIVSPVSRAPDAAVAKTSTANPLGVAVSADAPRRAHTGTDRLLPFRLNVQLETLTFRRRGNALRAEFVVHFAVAAPNGTMWPVDSREHSLEIPMNESPDALGGNVTYSWNVDLAPLRLPRQIPVRQNGMQLVVTVQDHASQVQSVVRIPIPSG